MQDLADRLGIAKPTLYALGGSKVEILGGIFERVLREVDDALDRIERLEDPAGRLEAVVLLHTRMSIQMRAHLLVFLGDGRELPPGTRDRFRIWEESYVAAVRTIISDGQDSGVFRTDVDATVLCMAIMGATNWTARWYDPAGPLSVEALAGTHWAVLMDGLKADPPLP